MATVKGRDLYKVPTTGKMTIANVISTCNSAGRDAPCLNTYYADSKCTLVKSGNHIFEHMRDVICPGLDFRKCKQLQNVFVYMTKKDHYGEGGKESYGVVDEKDVYGRDNVDKFALCVS